MPRTPNHLLYALLIIPIVLFSHCTYRAYYQSPYNANLETYHPIHLHSDSVRSGTYIGGNLTVGGANQRWKDGLYYLSGSIHRSSNFGFFQGYYGADLSIGAYKVNTYENPNVTPSAGIDIADINAAAGNKFFGGYGINGGIDFEIPLPLDRGEWRVLGISATLQNEFGNYLSFRKGLPDTAANTIFKGRTVGTLGFSTEFAFRTNYGMFGWKTSWGGPLLNPNHHYFGNDSTKIGMFYFSETLALTSRQYTGFMQFNIGGSAGSLQWGFYHQLGSRGASKKATFTY